MCRSPLRGVRVRVAGEGGATLIELVIALVVISVGVAGTLLAMRRTLASSADPMLVRQAAGIASSYLDEILGQRYLDPDTADDCPAAEGGGRAVYDNVCDYDLLDDMGARDATDAAVAGLGLYRVRVLVDPNATLDVLSGSAEVLRVDVWVTHTDRVDFTLSSYRTSY